MLRKSFSVLLKTPLVKIQIFRDRSFTLFLNYYFAKFLEILTSRTGSLEISCTSFFKSNRSQLFEQLRMHCI